MKKLYYSIGEVSKLTGVEPHILRYWETIFDELTPGKNSSGQRMFTEKHVNVVLRLKELIQDKKYSTAGAKHVLKEESGERTRRPKQPDIPVEVKKDLTEIKHFLQNLLTRL